MDEAAISFGHALPNLQGLSDQEFLRRIVWRRSIRSKQADAARDGNVSRFCKLIMQNHPFSRRGRIGARNGWMGDPPWQFLWSKPAFSETECSLLLTTLVGELSHGDRKSPRGVGFAENGARGKGTLHGLRNGANDYANKRVSRLVGDWLDALNDGHPLSPLELLGAFELLRLCASQLSADMFFRLWRIVFSAATNFPANGQPANEGGLMHDQALLVHGELRWLAGIQFPDVRRAARLRRSGQQHMWRCLEDGTDTDGTPCADLMERLALWMAPLVRVTLFARSLNVRLWSDEGRIRYRRLVKTAAKFSQPGGETALGRITIPNALGLWESAFHSAGLSRKHPRLLCIRTKPAGKSVHARNGRWHAGPPSGAKRKRTKTLPVAQSDWSQVAFLRNEWSANSDSVAVAHHQPDPIVDISLLGRLVFSGPWALHVTHNDTPVPIKNEWNAVCWQSDSDCDYLELQMQCGGGLRIERQVLLSRTDHVLLLADSISDSPPGPIEYSTGLSLVDGIQVVRNSETRSIELKDRQLLVRAYPLALPQDRAISTPGEFAVDGRQLILRQTGVGRGLYAPLVFDWEPRRKRHFADWRSLTVTEIGKVLTRDIAAGHRLRVGNHQLLIYRSLARTGEARAVLGYHTYNETAIGRFTDFGELEPILLVE